MRETITCFLFYHADRQEDRLIEELSSHPYTDHIYLLTGQREETALPASRCSFLPLDSFGKTETFREIVRLTKTPYTLLYTTSQPFELGRRAIERMCDYLEAPESVMAYADHYLLADGDMQPHPVIDYQPGSVRDDFDFGPLMLVKTDALRKAYERILAQPEYQYSALYAWRLALSEQGELTHIREYLYTRAEEDLRKSGEKQFDYVDPRNRAVQLERETAFTYYLKNVGRVRTIRDAIRSAIGQETDFPYNIIIVDNHSTDGTTECIDEFAANPKVLHLIPSRHDLGIGGCWDMAVSHPLCGRFAVQLDSDDLYSGPDTLQRIVDKFHKERCAMVIGSYRMTDFNLETLPPGVIEHR